MTEPAPRSAELDGLGCAGIAALLFAASPSISLALLAFAESQQHRNRPQGGGPVGFGVPPIWCIWLILLGLSLPWILAGILLLRHVSAGRWIALLLTFPTAFIAVLSGAGTLVAMQARDEMAAQNVRAFGPVACWGMVFCLIVWGVEYSFWTQRRKAALPIDEHRREKRDVDV